MVQRGFHGKYPEFLFCYINRWKSFIKSENLNQNRKDGKIWVHQNDRAVAWCPWSTFIQKAMFTFPLPLLSSSWRPPLPSPGRRRAPTSSSSIQSPEIRADELDRSWWQWCRPPSESWRQRYIFQLFMWILVPAMIISKKIFGETLRCCSSTVRVSFIGLASPGYDQ